MDFEFVCPDPHLHGGSKFGSPNHFLIRIVHFSTHAYILLSNALFKAGGQPNEDKFDFPFCKNTTARIKEI